MNQTHLTIGGKLALSALAVAALAACSTPVGIRDKVEAQYKATQSRAAAISAESPSIAEQAGRNVKGGKFGADIAAAQQKNMPVARRASAPFIGSSMVPVTSEDKLPSIFAEPFTLDFSDQAHGTDGVSLSKAMARLSKLSGVPIRIQPDVYGEKSGSVVRVAAVPQPLPPVGSPMPSPVLTNGGRPQAQPGAATQPAPPPAARADAVSTVEPTSLLNVDMKYSGTLAGYLNSVTDRLGLSWEYRDNTIVVMKYVVELHEVFTFPGSQKFAFSSSGSGSGSGGGGGASNAASASASVDESGESSPLATIEKSIAQIVADVPGSSVTRTDGSGRLMVKTSREMQSRVRDYIKTENNAMRRQAQIQFDIYSVTTDEGDERGINWVAILQKAGEAAQMRFSSPSSLATAESGIASISILPGIEGNKFSELLGNSGALIQAMNSSGYAAQHRPVSLLALNRQWGRISRLSTEYYLSETTPGPASSTGVGAPGLKTDKITTGDQYVAMPQILDDNTVLLKFGMSLSDLLGLFDVSVGSGALQQKVQAPRITAVNAQFPVAVKPGEVVAVTGLSRLVASTDSRRLAEGAPIALGGSNKVSYKREHFIVFIRPLLM